MAGRQTRLVLASASPRRRQLLELLGLRFDVAAAEVDETVGPRETGEQIAWRLSATKALAGADEPERVVLAADTVVEVDGRPLGKPADRDEALAMLHLLRGRPHRVLTGLAIAVGGRLSWQAIVDTVVEMRRYREEELERYVASGRPFDKAGAYAIQDVDFRPAERVRGCYPNVVGLPLCETARGLLAVDLRPAVAGNDLLEPPCALCQRALPPEFRGTDGGMRLEPRQETLDRPASV